MLVVQICAQIPTILSILAIQSSGTACQIICPIHLLFVVRLSVAVAGFFVFISDPFGSVLVVGVYAGAAQLSIDSGSPFVHTASGNRDIFVTKLTSAGDLRFVTFASTADDENVVGADVAHAPAKLRLIGEVAAGHPFPGLVGPGEVARIFTGGVLPGGADTVVMQENTTREGNEAVAGGRRACHRR